MLLWVLALAAAVILPFLGGADTALRLARNDDAIAHARALAESGISLAVLGLTDPDPAKRWPADSTPRRVSFDGGTVAIKVEDENGKIDLNVAPPELFIGLFRTLGASDAAATAIASAIIARRSGQGEAAGDSTAPVPQQFFSVAELLQIPGVSHDLFRRAAPSLTTYSFSPDINPMTAPADVLRSLPGVNDEAIEAFLASRGAAASTPPLPATSDVEIAPLLTVTITAQAQTASGARFSRQAVVSLTASGGAPFTILAWGQPRRTTADDR